KKQIRIRPKDVKADLFDSWSYRWEGDRLTIEMKGYTLEPAPKGAPTLRLKFGRAAPDGPMPLPLLNGKDLTGWVGDAKVWKVEGKALIFHGKYMSPLRTEKTFDNYIVRFEHWVEPDGSEKPFFTLALHEPTAEEAKDKDRERLRVEFHQGGNGLYGLCDY